MVSNFPSTFTCTQVSKNGRLTPFFIVKFEVWIDVIDALGEGAGTMTLKVPDVRWAGGRHQGDLIKMYMLAIMDEMVTPWLLLLRFMSKVLWYRVKATTRNWSCKVRVSLFCHPLHTRPPLPAPLSLCVNGTCMSYGNNCQKDLTVKVMTWWCSSTEKV